MKLRSCWVTVFRLRVLKVPRMAVCPALGEEQEIGGPGGNCSGHAASVKHPLGNRERKRTAGGHPCTKEPCVSLQPCIPGLSDVNWIWCCNVLSDQMAYRENPLNVKPYRLNKIAKPLHSLPERSYSFRSSVI